MLYEVGSILHANVQELNLQPEISDDRIHTKNHKKHQRHMQLLSYFTL